MKKRDTNIILLSAITAINAISVFKDLGIVNNTTINSQN